MSTHHTTQHEAARYFTEGCQLYERGALRDAIPLLRQSVLLYAALPDEVAEQATFRRLRADACQRFADFLAESGEHAEAANIYQEAVDLYRLLGTEADEQEARLCAQKLLTCVDALRARPQERLYLLIAHYERQQQQFALEAGTERDQAECCMQIARVFQRRERFNESISRFQEALQLLAQVPQNREVQFASAECHHRIGTMLDRQGVDLPEAVKHYQEAIVLYTVSEPPIYGLQEARALCARALADVERRLGSTETSAQYSPEE